MPVKRRNDAPLFAEVILDELLLAPYAKLMDDLRRWPPGKRDASDSNSRHADGERSDGAVRAVYDGE